MALVGQLAPLTVELPAKIRLEYTRTDYADAAATKPHVTRVDARAVEATVASALDVYPF
jgi:D-aminopeptidase